jgi:hypothetical protein
VFDSQPEDFFGSPTGHFPAYSTVTLPPPATLLPALIPSRGLPVASANNVVGCAKHDLSGQTIDIHNCGAANFEGGMSPSDCIGEQSSPHALPETQSRLKVFTYSYRQAGSSESDPV